MRLGGIGQGLVWVCFWNKDAGSNGCLTTAACHQSAEAAAAASSNGGSNSSSGSSSQQQQQQRASDRQANSFRLFTATETDTQSRPRMVGPRSLLSPLHSIPFDCSQSLQNGSTSPQLHSVINERYSQIQIHPQQQQQQQHQQQQ
ncbi:GL19468 [Drosophila persimilis]|uniref:GL19468 n=1 Tax=Drosophila persimilis TaxID=7234 RepID=B4G9E6_DROPE|nr:GL19468 [Drosophila persimilis]